MTRQPWVGRVVTTSRAGDAQHARAPELRADAQPEVVVTVHLDRERHRFFGVGGSLTQASAAALRRLSAPKRREVLAAYFGSAGAAYALSRTHIASCDFSTESYQYVPAHDPSLSSFTIQPDRDNGLMQLIKDALAAPGADFALMASPWSPPAWMKDNGLLYDRDGRRGGRLLREHYETFARYFVKYLEAYAVEGVPIWAISPINEPQGNDGNWESMDMSPEEQRDFVKVLGPKLREAGLNTRILIFDQNRRELPTYTKVIYADAEAARFVFGSAVHWYNSTYKVYETLLAEERRRYPDKPIVHSEGTIDAVGPLRHEGDAAGPWWQCDAWYWKKHATDWGWHWAREEDKPDHPRYAPAFRYARDLVVGIGAGLAGWIDWNIVLDRHGGPNHASNWCLAPVMVDGETNEAYFSPTFHILSQVSRHSRPGAMVLDTTVAGAPPGFAATGLRNPDGSVALHIFNETEQRLPYEVVLGEHRGASTSPAASLQTYVLAPNGLVGAHRE